VAVVKRDELLAFQERVIHALSGEESIAGVDPARVGLVRDLAKAKRIAKIDSVLPRTCRLLGDDFSRLTSDFVNATPPKSFRSRADGLAFYRFLARRGVSAELLDLTYCELAISAMKTPSSHSRPEALSRAPRGSVAIRRAANVRLRRCRFDVRVFFEGDATPMAPIRSPSPIHVAIVADPLADAPRISQLSAGLFDLLRSLRTWHVLPGIADQDTKQFIDQLQQRGFLETAIAED
jgi:hypothetical protein